MAVSRAAELLRRMEAGDVEAPEELLSLLYRELHGIARQMMAGERNGHTLQTTALIHEAWLRLTGTRIEYEGQGHFLRTAALAMRRILVDHARAKRSAKRGGGRRAEPLDEALAIYEERSIDLLALDEALDRLRGIDEQLAQIVELRHFAGLTLEETGRALGISTTQAHRGWGFARGWLRRELDRT
jgi:RNA polymerase sigma factor (TIGR02999 family)